ncbi:MAG TPA: hypothetical protein VEU08_01400, partial [Vicinamibacterales bacterium]|nr:hypothetical protein [Vicinamibacterales bacterium]
MKRALALVSIIGAVACGSNSSSAPSAASAAQVTGTWRGTATVANVAGGECVASLFAGAIGESGPVTASLTQSGSTVTASLTSSSTSNVSTYTGSVAAGALALT